MGCNGLVLRREKPEPPMSQLGHFRQIDPLPTLSACPLRSDRVRTFAPQRNGAVCQKRPPAPQQSALLFDNLVSAQQERLGDRQAQRLGGCQVYDEVELGRLLDGDITRLRPAQNFVDIACGAPVKVWVVWSIGHQNCGLDVFLGDVNRRQSRAERQGVDSNDVSEHERVGNDIKGVSVALEPLEDRPDILRSPDFQCNNIEAELAEPGGFRFGAARSGWSVLHQSAFLLALRNASPGTECASRTSLPHFLVDLHLQSCGFTSRGYPVGGTPFVRLVAHCLESRPRIEGADFGICRTFAASPAEPGELPCGFGGYFPRGSSWAGGIYPAGPPCRSRLKDVDSGYMLAALFFFVMIWVATGRWQMRALRQRTSPGISQDSPARGNSTSGIASDNPSFGSNFACSPMGAVA